jgi:hypothetical protein
VLFRSVVGGFGVVGVGVGFTRGGCTGFTGSGGGSGSGGGFGGSTSNSTIVMGVRAASGTARSGTRETAT